MSSSQRFNPGRYFRLMTLSFTNILDTIPVGKVFTVNNMKDLGEAGHGLESTSTIHKSTRSQPLFGVQIFVRPDIISNHIAARLAFSLRVKTPGMTLLFLPLSFARCTFFRCMTRADVMKLKLE